MGSSISPVWSYLLTGIGVFGLALVYARPRSIAGPVIGLAVQALWIAYAVTTEQWGFLGSAVAFGAANVYGLRSRRAAARPSREPGSSLSDKTSPEYARFWNAVASTLNSFCIRHGYTRPYFSERNEFVLTVWRALHPDSPLPANAITPFTGPPRPRRNPPPGGAGEAPARRAITIHHRNDERH